MDGLAPRVRVPQRAAVVHAGRRPGQRPVPTECRPGRPDRTRQVADLDGERATGIPAYWTWPATEAENEQAYQAATAGSERERDHIREDLLVTWHAERCAVCGTFRGDAGRGRLVWDHDHDTGEVRGLLCGSCNTKEPHSTRPEFAGYRTRAPAVILGAGLFHSVPSSPAALCGVAAVEALARWQQQNDPARPQ